MKPISTTAGTATGCITWIIAISVIASCAIPVALIFATLTSTTELSAGVVGPMVCPSGSNAVIENSKTTLVGENGVEYDAVGAEMVCVDEGGNVVANPAPLPNWVWAGVNLVLSLLCSVALGLLLAAPIEVMVGKITARLAKK
jgi:hypothetical protein